MLQEFQAKEPAVIPPDPDAPGDCCSGLAQYRATRVLAAAETLENGGSGETAEHQE